MSKTHIFKDGSRAESFLCGCSVATTYVDKKTSHVWAKCSLHKRAAELKESGMNIHQVLTQSLFEQIAKG